MGICHYAALFNVLPKTTIRLRKEKIQFSTACAHHTSNLRAQLTTPVLIRLKTGELRLQLRSYHNYLRRTLTTPYSSTNTHTHTTTDMHTAVNSNVTNHPRV